MLAPKSDPIAITITESAFFRGARCSIKRLTGTSLVRIECGILSGSSLRGRFAPEGFWHTPLLKLPEQAESYFRSNFQQGLEWRSTQIMLVENIVQVVCASKNSAIKQPQEEIRAGPDCTMHMRDTDRYSNRCQRKSGTTHSMFGSSRAVRAAVFYSWGETWGRSPVGTLGDLGSCLGQVSPVVSYVM